MATHLRGARLSKPVDFRRIATRNLSMVEVLEHGLLSVLQPNIFKAADLSVKGRADGMEAAMDSSVI
jgi:hypothetical protein